jgi:hypothetical protein
MKVFEFVLVAHGRGNDPLEALEDVMAKVQENPRKVIEPDIEYAELPQDKECLLAAEAAKAVCLTTPPWNAPSGES